GALGNTMQGSGANGGTDFRVRQRFNTTVRLPGYGGANTDDAAVIAFIQARNPGSETGSATHDLTTGGGGFVGGAACTAGAAPTLPDFVFDNGVVRGVDNVTTQVASAPKASVTSQPFIAVPTAQVASRWLQPRRPTARCVRPMGRWIRQLRRT